MFSVISSLSLLAIAARPAAAWGNLGHEAVGYVAQEFLAPSALAFVQSSLGSTYNESLGVAATWADSVKYTKGYTWSAPLHFVDAEDSPLSGSCSVSESRDCGDGDCILTAIANYTTRVAQTSLSKTQRQEALKWLDHYLGDIGQPLHVEAYEVGGNDIDATCNGKSTNLHSAWDTGILTKNIDDNYSSSVTTYAAALTAKIKSGAYKSLADGWLACASTTAPASKAKARRFLGPLSTETETDSLVGLVGAATPATPKARASAAITPLACPLVWAKESNAYCCSVVFTYTTDQDLCTGTYYTKAVPVIDLQIAKQGYRLAAWLNVIFDGDTSLP
ncbi:nuclease Le1 [Lentinus tigrinus ALCF2SS1-7]|uniref:Nuclease Le1 n=1 Tax=Lentinus tigrinus ALCF2SS1-6 TaxID=1328759 RepID=A0A5C2RTT8_9APHY|nr:nuclease Le1 [Lentinus tigrinus ALCF2SS1-6]RPD73664.1 nuclease Le1 [Lentinus tigrinus ALCF2SS1-7]